MLFLIYKMSLKLFAYNTLCPAYYVPRYDAITHPMNFSGSWRRARVLVAISWILSALFSSPILFFYETTETEEYGWVYRGEK